MINVGIFSPSRFPAVERINARVKDWRDLGSLLLCLQLKNPSTDFYFSPLMPSFFEKTKADGEAMISQQSLFSR